MAITVGAFEAKTHLSKLLDRVEAGEEIVITRNGKPVAKLSAITDAASEKDRAEAIRRIRERSEHLTLGGISWKELRDAGRKY